MRITDVLAVMPVADYESSVGWYARLFGREADNVPMPTCHEWQLTDSGWLQVIDAAERAGGSMLTMAVDNVDAEATALADRAVDVRDIRTVSPVLRLGTVMDPCGNAITLAEDLLDS